MTFLRVSLLAALVFAAISTAGAASTQSDITALLNASVNAWNHGDLDAFMTCYERSDETVLVGAKTVVRGYANIRAHYRAAYSPDRMGTLALSEVTIRPIGPRDALVILRYRVTFRDGSKASGLSSLTLHRGNAGWHIVADHSP